MTGPGEVEKDPGMDTPPRILIVDDVPMNIAMVQALLKSEGYELVSAESGDEALRAVAEQIPDLILLDIQMPDMDGYEVCERLRASPETEGVPVIMFTATESETEAKAKGLRIGANDYVTKPVAKDELLARIETQLRLKVLEKQRLLAEQLSIIGQMVTTLHHEINNPLTGVLGSTEVLLDKMSRKVVPLDEIEKALITIRDGSRRIRDVMIKLGEVTKPVVEDYSAGTSMIDIEES
ncbi:response regulator [Gemmatimonadota bacterium]